MNEWSDAESHVERAHDAYEAGLWDEAESELREAISINPFQPEWHFNLGLTLEAAGRFRDAVAAFGDASELHPDDPQSPLMAASNCLKLGEPRDALRWLDRAAKNDPSGTQVHVQRIDAFTQLGEHEQAELAFYMGQQLDDQDADLYAAIAESLLRRSMSERAVWCLEQALKLDDSIPGVHARLASVHAAAGRRDLARRHYLMELRRDPGDLVTLLDLGDLLVEMGRPDEAGEKYRRVIELDATSAEAHMALGSLLLDEGKPAEAGRHFEQVLQLDPGFPRARLYAAEAMMAQPGRERISEARALLTRESESFEPQADGPSWEPDDLEVFARLLAQVGLASRAVPVSATLLTYRPNEAAAHHLHGLVLHQDNRTVEAQEAWRRAVELDPRFLPAMVSLIVASAHSKRWGECVRWSARAVQVAPHDPDLRRAMFWLRVREAVDPVARMVRRVIGRRER